MPARERAGTRHAELPTGVDLASRVAHSNRTRDSAFRSDASADVDIPPAKRLEALCISMVSVMGRSAVGPLQQGFAEPNARAAVWLYAPPSARESALPREGAQTLTVECHSVSSGLVVELSTPESIRSLERRAGAHR